MARRQRPYDLAELADLLGVHRVTLTRRLHDGRIHLADGQTLRVLRVGRRTLVGYDEVGRVLGEKTRVQPKTGRGERAPGAAGRVEVDERDDPPPAPETIATCETATGPGPSPGRVA